MNREIDKCLLRLMYSITLFTVFIISYNMSFRMYVLIFISIYENKKMIDITFVLYQYNTRGGPKHQG